MRRQTMHRLLGLLISILICSAAWAQTTAQMSGTIKNAHSPAGMGYDTYSVALVNEIDCPTCKYGTLLRAKLDEKSETIILRCIDCKAHYELILIGPPNQQTIRVGKKL